MQTAIVSIRDKSWEVEVATTSNELSTGLGGKAFLEPWHGMLFDLGSNRSEILINVRDMLFPIDIMFFSEDRIVQAMVWNLRPEDEEFLATFTGDRARFFLETNEGELGDVTVGDIVVIEGYTPPVSSPDTGELMSPMIGVMMMVMIMGMVMKMMK